MFGEYGQDGYTMRKPASSKGTRKLVAAFEKVLMVRLREDWFPGKYKGSERWWEQWGLTLEES